MKQSHAMTKTHHGSMTKHKLQFQLKTLHLIVTGLIVSTYTFVILRKSLRNRF